jgi:hypothetical protein
LLLRERCSSINLAVKRNFADVPIFHFPKTQYSLAQTWLARAGFYDFGSPSIATTALYSRQVAPPDPVPVSGRGGQANIPIVSEAN